MSHVNATLTPRTRLRLARLIVDDHWTYSAAATMFMVSPRTAKKWADRYRAEGPQGMTDRSSRPRTSPKRTFPNFVRATAARTGQRGRHYRPSIWPAYVHTVIDDHSRVAYAEIGADESIAPRGW